MIVVGSTPFRKGVIMIWRLGPNAGGLFYRHAPTFPCLLPVLVFRIQQRCVGVAFPFLSFVPPGWFLCFPSLTFRSFLKPRGLQQRWSTPSSDFVVLFLVSFPSRSAVHIYSKRSEQNLTHIPLHILLPGFFILCHTVLCSIGVWNLSLVQTRPYNCSYPPSYPNLSSTSSL